jgi:hypothetical protein
MMIKSNNVASNIVKALLAKFNASGLDPVAILPAKIGTKAALKAPSANMRRKKLGNLKAMLKQSVAMLTPKYEDNSASRTKPNILEDKVSNPTVTPDFISDMALGYFWIFFGAFTKIITEVF